MRILHVNTFDKEGGAGLAAWRIHEGLKSISVESQMLVQTRTSGDVSVYERDTRLARALSLFRPYLDMLPLLLYKKRLETHWSVEWFPARISRQIQIINPDIVHLHWICRGFVDIPALASFKKPIVWTLHDSWTFTGGCHVPGDCLKYKDCCGCCPQLGSKHSLDLSRWTWKRKRKFWRDMNLTIVTPSNWLAECAKNSSLLKRQRIEVIQNGIDINQYRPIDKKTARLVLDLPQDRKLILFSAMNATYDMNKGFRFLEAALRSLSEKGWNDSAELIVAGQSAPSTPVDTGGVPCRFLGVLKDEISMRLAYSAADVTVMCSAQENLPNSIMESMACGTPVVAFNIGGVPHLVDHEINGYLARPFSVDDIADGLLYVLSDQDRWQRLSEKARGKIEQKFNVHDKAQQYVALYRQLLSGT
jgi:glycosyltransferase involved in cell wall biosynthesis